MKRIKQAVVPTVRLETAVTLMPTKVTSEQMHSSRLLSRTSPGTLACHRPLEDVHKTATISALTNKSPWDKVVSAVNLPRDDYSIHEKCSDHESWEVGPKANPAEALVSD
jgi:hypothetical protein